MLHIITILIMLSKKKNEKNMNIKTGSCSLLESSGQETDDFNIDVQITGIYIFFLKVELQLIQTHGVMYLKYRTIIGDGLKIQHFKCVNFIK